MNRNPQKEALLVRNLYDAGCPQEFVEHFLMQHSKQNTSELIRLLTEHRGTILSSVHEEQAKLDCTDYLLFQLKRKKPSPH